MSTLENEQEIEAYDFAGKGTTSENKMCVAKKVSYKETNITKFFIKVCTHGMNSGLFFDPNNNYKEELGKFDNQTGRLRFTFKATSKESFDGYVKFLVSKNPSLLSNAQRCQNG